MSIKLPPCPWPLEGKFALFLVEGSGPWENRTVAAHTRSKQVFLAALMMNSSLLSSCSLFRVQKKKEIQKMKGKEVESGWNLWHAWTFPRSTQYGLCYRKAARGCLARHGSGSSHFWSVRWVLWLCFTMARWASWTCDTFFFNEHRVIGQNRKNWRGSY